MQTGHVDATSYSIAHFAVQRDSHHNIVGSFKIPQAISILMLRLLIRVANKFQSVRNIKLQRIMPPIVEHEIDHEEILSSAQHVTFNI